MLSNVSFRSQTALEQITPVSPQIRMHNPLPTRPLAKHRVQPLSNGGELPKPRCLGFQQRDGIQVQLQHGAVGGRVIPLERSSQRESIAYSVLQKARNAASDVPPCSRAASKKSLASFRERYKCRRSWDVVVINKTVDILNWEFGDGRPGGLRDRGREP